MNVSDFKKLMEEHAPCEQGADLFQKCRGRLEVFDLAVSQHAYDYLVRSIQEGWGPTTEDMVSVFRPYINGRRTAHLRTSAERDILAQMWCASKDVDIEDGVRLVLLIGCRGMIHLRDWQTVHFVVDANSSVTFDAQPTALVYVDNYGGTAHDLNGNCKIRHHNAI